MAGSVNKVIIIGNLGADPDVRTTQSGQTVATLSIATSENFTTRDGQRQERTEWHRVVVWNKLAELAQRYLQKGRKVYIEGRIQTRSWDDQQTGQKKYSTEIIAQEMTFLDSGRGDGAGAEGGGGYSGGGGGGGYGGGGGGGGRGNYGGGGGGGGNYGGGGGGGPRTGGNQRPATGQQSGPPAGPADNGPDPEFFDDDIPF
ncbi:MAG: single-stranded DNA-binding protein [Deltaproteobacteria bacterium]|nr:single-stranded DNA-binding protein [Deltaproteobacteria bacterium]